MRLQIKVRTAMPWPLLSSHLLAHPAVAQRRDLRL